MHPRTDVTSTLLQRIKEREDRLANRVVPPPRKEAEWVRRAREKRLPTRISYGSDTAA